MIRAVENFGGAGMEGMAWAYGVYRKGPAGSAEDYRAELGDLELQASVRGAGVWEFTDWDKLPEERREERKAAADAEAAKDGKGGPVGKIDPNSASRDELMSLPGIGEVMANAIIEGREEGKYRKAEDLERVKGRWTAAVEQPTSRREAATGERIGLEARWPFAGWSPRHVVTS